MLKKTIGMGGFTLAEVLITLGIIGVVAAMTMPTLINSTQGAQYKTAFKKSLTVLSQAVVMNIALNDYDLSQVVAGTNATSTAADGKTTAATGAQSLYDLFSNRLNVVREAGSGAFSKTAGDANQWIVVSNTDKKDYEDFATAHSKAGGTGGMGTAVTANKFPTLTVGDKWPDDLTFLFMNDGITFIFDNKQGNCQQADAGIGIAADNYCYGFIDVNGQKAPNRVVQCDTGSNKGTSGADDSTCTVSNPTDIYPIAMYNQSVIPASAAARAVLYNK